MKTVILKTADGRTSTVSIPEDYNPVVIRYNFGFYVKTESGEYIESIACEIGLDGQLHLL